MAKNDVLLLDKVISSTQDFYGTNYEKSELFELFCFDQILKNNDLTFDEITGGWVDGKDDGGIDGFFIFLDDIYITELPNQKKIRNQPILELVIITCKHHDTFKQEPVNNLLSTIPELLDISIENDNLLSDYNEDVLAIRDLFRELYIELATKNPKLKINYIYASRGQSDIVAENIQSKCNLLLTHTENLFSNIDTSFQFVGATELLDLFRTKKSYSLRLKFIENTISRAKTNYVILCKLTDFYNFISDENGNLRRYLFESNVRDYLGTVGVNQDIETTLNSNEAETTLDFWWLNNGVTILASLANVAGKEISLENIQIVNGLQTTETIFQHFTQKSNTDERAVLVKIIVAKDELLRDKIIRATNNQSPVDIASLRAMDKIQRDIEQILAEGDFYYDRRKNFYKNQGKPIDKIISPSYLSASIQALCLHNLAKAANYKSRFFRDDNEYLRIFNEKWNIEVFLSVIQIQKKTDHLLYGFHFNDPEHNKTHARTYRYMFSYIYCSCCLQKISYSPNELINIKNIDISKQKIELIWSFILECKQKYMNTIGSNTRFKKPHRNERFHELLKKELPQLHTTWKST